MINFAHRGYSGLYPENTMLAFKKAIEIGASGIELDVHLTKDKEIVIIHDELLDRTTNGTGLVMDHTLKELKTLNASILFSQYDIQQIPTLREYFELLASTNLITNIELKNSVIDYPGLEKEVYNLIKEYDIADKIIISSFNHESLVRMKAIDKSIKCGVLESSRLHEPWNYIKNIGMDYYHPMNFVVTEELAYKCKSNNIGLNIWFGISKWSYNEYLKFNPVGLITDFPEKVFDM